MSSATARGSEDSRLTAQITLYDAERLQKNLRRQGGANSDADLALSLYAAEARSSIVIDDDRALAQALQAFEGEEAGVALGSAERFHVPASRDRFTTGTLLNRARLPARRAHSPQLPPVQPTLNPPTTSDLGIGGWLMTILHRFFPASSSTSRFTLSPASATNNCLTGHDCVICQDPIRDVEIQAPCGHHYDKSCVIDLFQAATRDESLFPPRCCRTPIPFTAVQPHLPGEFVALFKGKEMEFKTLNRVYCASPTCSRFLGPACESYFRSTITCSGPGCSTRTCNRCKSKVEGSMWHFCNPSEKDQEVLALGKDAKWARCPGCGQMIELIMGCYHMTCRCKTEFCYLCSARWKTCSCTQWDEDMLLAAAERQVAARLAVQPHHMRPLRPLAAERVRPVPRPILLPHQDILHAVGPTRPLAARRNQPVSVNTPISRLSSLNAMVNNRPLQNYVHSPPTIDRSDNIPALEDTADLYRHRTRQIATAISQRQPSTMSTKSSSALVGQGSKPVTPIRKVRPDEEQALRMEARKRIEERRKTHTSRSSPTERKSSLLSTREHREEPASQRDAAAGIPARSSISLAVEPQRGTGAPSRPIKINPSELHRAQLMREIERLRVNHHCTHKDWVYRRGGGRCETCHHDLPLFLFRCIGCQTLACVRCRRNRL